ncbi:NAD(+) salvage pathway protein [Lambiella insularis]|nr:NAD(+) salvage pathway protein [Lambiella insularis]
MDIPSTFVPALLVVDMQEDFCLPVWRPRELAPVINALLKLPFTLKVATKDFHPPGHIPFDTSRSAPNNKAFESSVTVENPTDRSETMQMMLWPAHCIQGTPGAKIIPEIDAAKFDALVEKGKDERRKEIPTYTLWGLTGDACVKCTAVDARKEGFQTYVIQGGTRSVNEGKAGWGAALKEFANLNIGVVSTGGPEIARVK